MSFYLTLQIYKHLSIPFVTSRYVALSSFRSGKATDSDLRETAKRYAVQIFVSLDLSALSEVLAGGGIATTEMVLLEMEKSLIKELDKILPRESKK